jgi:Transport and Golgi organisation 2
MCTAIVSVGPVLLLAGVRDEFTGRAWQPPARHWPQYPGLTGGLDLVAGGTWLAVAADARRVACVLNGRGPLAPAASRRSRGVLPLQAAAEGKLAQAELADFDPFHLLIAEPGRAGLVSWDGTRLTGQDLAPGLHMIVNSGLDSDVLRPGKPGDTNGGPGREHELARLDYFLPRLRSARRPDPLTAPGPDPLTTRRPDPLTAPGPDPLTTRRPDPLTAPGPDPLTVEQAWGDWLPLMNGDGLADDDPRALIVRHDFGDGRVWGTTSISLVALAAGGVRYDFTARPGDPSGWHPVKAVTDRLGR